MIPEHRCLNLRAAFVSRRMRATFQRQYSLSKRSLCFMNSRAVAFKLSLALLLLFVPLIAGCSTRDLGAEAAGKTKVGIVFDIGGKDDRSFNSAANEGVLRAKKDFPI